MIVVSFTEKHKKKKAQKKKPSLEISSMSAQLGYIFILKLQYHIHFMLIVAFLTNEK
jgi:hypothetical protein